MQALYFKPSYERLRERIHAAAPELDVVLYDEAGTLVPEDAARLPVRLPEEVEWSGVSSPLARMPDFINATL